MLKYADNIRNIPRRKKKTEKARVTAFLDNVSRMYSFGENPYQRNDKISDSGLERTPEAFGSESHS